jgi:hypothetical protein
MNEALRHALCALSDLYVPATDKGPEVFKCSKCHKHVALVGSGMDPTSTKVGWLPPCMHSVHFGCAASTCAKCNKPVPLFTGELRAYKEHTDALAALV